MIRPIRSTLALGLTLLAFAAPAVAQETLRIGTEAAYKPFAYVLPSGELTGFDIDITNALCKQMQVECTITNMAFDGLIPALNANKIDAIIASMAITAEREQTLGFAGPYYSLPAMFIGAKDAGLEATTEGLDGKYIGVQRGSTMSNYVTTNFPNATVQAYDTVEAAVLDLGSGRVDLVFADSVVLSEFLATPDGSDFAVVGEPVFDRATLGIGAGIGVRLDDTELKAKFNEALAAIIASGEYKSLNEKYVPIDILPK